MAVAARKRFRVEAAEVPSDPAATRHIEMMAEIAALKAEIARRPAVATPASDQTAREVLDLYKSELNEARKLKDELEAITAAITRTKEEIAALHIAREQGGAMHRMSNELDAVVAGTEGATNAILAAAEAIDERARDLAAKLSGDDNGMAADIADHVLRIFEACNFQDLTGQRIAKVVGVLHFVEDRVAHMLEIWGGIESFKDVRPSVVEERRTGDAKLLNGPALPSDDGRATQDMIDALFG
jgi:chemotaxis protein CheZ